MHAKRVLAYLSLADPDHPAQPRTGLAGHLWSDVPAERSQASLRIALWRIRQAAEGIVRVSRETVRLDERVEVDVRTSTAQAHRLLAGGPDLRPSDADVRGLRGDLLPGWEEDWLLLERERVRQVQIHALEALARRLCGLGRHLEAIEAALAAIAREPLRESAHAVLIDVFLAEGNAGQARQQFDRYVSLLRSETRARPVGRPEQARGRRLGQHKQVAESAHPRAERDPSEIGFSNTSTPRKRTSAPKCAGRSPLHQGEDAGWAARASYDREGGNDQ
jgi:DNA-binding SARP family transcriptional activator